MIMKDELNDFISGLLAPTEKTASGLEALTLFELEALMDLEKVADGDPRRERDLRVGAAVHRGGHFIKKAVSEDWVRRVVRGAKASPARLEQSAAKHWHESERLGDQLSTKFFSDRTSPAAKATEGAFKKRDAAYEAAVDRGAFKKSSLDKVGGIIKKAGNVEYTGHVHNGVPSNPEWPRAALGVDAAGRKATDEEMKVQTTAKDPDIQHVAPQSGGDQFVAGTTEDARLLGGLGKLSSKMDYRPAQRKTSSLYERLKLSGADKSVFMRIGDLASHARPTTQAGLDMVHKGMAARASRAIERPLLHASAPPMPKAKPTPPRGQMLAANQSLARAGLTPIV